MKHLLAIASVAGLFTVLLAPISAGHTEFWRRGEDLAHAPLFALIAIGALEYSRQKIRGKPYGLNHYALAFVIALTLGIAGELAQLLFSSTREAQLMDVFEDACGALAALCFHAHRNVELSLQHKRWNLTVALGALALLIAPIAQTGASYLKRWTQLPELVSWDSSLGHHFLATNGTDIALATVPQKWSIATNEDALYISPNNSNRWAGIVIEEPWPNWSLYTQLAIEVVNPNDSPLELILRIDDRGHNRKYDDRFNRTLTIQAHARARLLIPLNEVKAAPATRKLELSQIAQLLLFQDTERTARAYYLCGIRLLA